ncbi:MAG: hypothetical protein WD963_01425 [Candidatus Paceibacterota bacterium]
MMQFIKRNLSKMVLLAFLIVVPVISLAQPTADPGGAYPSDPGGAYPSDPNAGKLVNPLKRGGIDNIPKFIEVLLKGVLKIGIPLIALAIIYCGFLFVAARGNSEKLTKAKDALLYTLIGAAILLGSWAIAQLISETVLSL